MKILNFTPNLAASQYRNRFLPQNKNNNGPINNGPVNYNVLNSYSPVYYLYNSSFDLSFGAKERVNKGLERFYSANKDIMPDTVKKYIDSMPQIKMKEITPIAAQQNAFEELIIAENVDDVKVLFPDEPLFEDLKPVSENKAKRGILYDMRLMQKDLEETGESILKSGEELTIYLLKKVFLENKTLNQINEDLDLDLNPVFQNENKEYMTYSSLSSLGIKLPKHEYLTSLRYTKEGYSDDISGKISKGLAAYWDSLSDEEKLEKRKASLTKLENWWQNLSDEDKMALLEKQDSEIKLLNAYKKDAQNALKQDDCGHKRVKTADSALKEETERPKTINKPKEKLETSLSNDEIFLEWARKNLEIFELGLSDEQKAELGQKRAEASLSRWQNLTPEEKTALIEKMQTGAFNQKIAMIDAWNNCSDVREHLSSFMKENNLHGTFGIIYRDTNFSESQSKIMSAFWEKYPEDAVKLGDEIRNSFAKIKESIKDDTFDALKIGVLDKQAEIKKAQKQKKKWKANGAAILGDAPKNAAKEALRQAQDKFVDYYHRMYYFMPKDFLDSYCDFALENLKDARALDIWARTNIGGVNLDEMKYLTGKISPIQDSPEMFRKKRAMEQALADVLYEASNKNEAALSLFGAKFKDLQTMMLTVESHIMFPVEINCTNGSSIVLTKRPDASKLEKLYNKYKEPIDPMAAKHLTDICLGAADNIDAKYNITDRVLANKVRASFKNFLQMYGASISCIMSDSNCPGQNQAFNKFVKLFFEQDTFKDMRR